MRYKKEERLGLEKLNNQGCLMKIIEYKDVMNITVEFQDEFKYKTLCQWESFKNGKVKNPYFPSVYNVGIVGTKYETVKNSMSIKEYDAWNSMLQRCYDNKYKERQPTYEYIYCCNEWFYFPNFYEWLHSQENFDKWLNGKRWALDKDILIKGNKIYSPDTCCLVPSYVNSLFVKTNKSRGNLPIGVSRMRNKYRAMVSTNSGRVYLPIRKNPEDCFYLDYKPFKENYIKQIAQEEFDKGNITKKCYDAMINYQVEITD